MQPGVMWGSTAEVSKGLKYKGVETMKNKEFNYTKCKHLYFGRNNIIMVTALSGDLAGTDPVLSHPRLTGEALCKPIALSMFIPWFPVGKWGS